MSGLRRQLVAALALLVVVFGQLTPANATPVFPSSFGETTKQLIQIDRSQLAQVEGFFATLGISPSHTYTDVFSGFAVDLTADQKEYLQYLLPGIVIKPDQPVEVADTQDDATWGLSSLDSLGLSSDASYSYPTSAGLGVKVYVVDSGISPNPEEFGSRLLPGYDALGQSVTTDCNSHGTHVAGTIGSKTYGVAKRASLVPVRVLNCDGSGMTSDLIRGIDWVVRDNPAGNKAVMNLSLGSDRNDFFLNLAVNNAKNDGVFPVVAAGNDSRDACNYSPANSPAAFTVGSVDASNRLSYFSNTGSCISILAPGSSILSLSNENPNVNSLKSGTSMAAPHVAGVAALYLAENPGATMNGIRDALLNNADASAVDVVGTTTKIVKAKFLVPVQQTDSSSGSNSGEGDLVVEAAEEPTPPANSSAPSVTGEPFVSQVLTAEDGTWTGSPTPSLSYQWYACSAVVLVAVSVKPASCAVIAGATGKTLTLGTAQRAKFVTAEVKATAGSDSVSSFAPSTAFAVTTAPTVKLTATGSGGTVRFTQATTTSLNTKFTVSVTGFSAPATYTYKWFRCETAKALSASSPEGCVEIAGATKNAYVVTSADLGSFITPFVRANKGASVLASARIASTKDVMQSPVSAGDPSAPGELLSVGQSITALNGSWLGDPTFSYQWYSCSKAVPAAKSKNTACSIIAGATQKTFEIPSSQNNKFLVVQVLATNATNQTAPVSRYSATSTKVLLGPSVTAEPTIDFAAVATTGQPIVGSVISGRAAKWGGNPAPSVTRQWYLCDTDFEGGVVSDLPSDCSEIAGATGASVTALLAWQGKFVTFAEVGRNDVASVTVAASVNQSVQTKPLFSADPELSGSASTGSSLTATANASNVGGAPTPSYQWFKCLAAQETSETQPAGCSSISGATSSTFGVSRAQEGSYLSARVTLTNVAGTTVKFTATTDVVTGDVANLTIEAPATASGHTRVGQSIVAGAATWSGYPEPTFTYQWFQCDDLIEDKSASQPDGCRMAGGVSSTYTPVVADSGKYLVVRVTASQDNAEAVVFSPSSEQVWEAPNFSLLNPPAIGSANAKGEVLTSSTSGARGVPVVSKSYQWYRCPTYVESDAATLAAGCVLINNATSENYTFVAGDVGKYVLVAVTISNSLGNSKRFTRSSTIVSSQPENISIPVPSVGTAVLKIGAVLTAGNGQWSALPDPTFTYQWVRCDVAVNAKSDLRPGSCSNINGSRSATYQLSTADSGKFVAVAVTATNENGFATVHSPTTAAVGEPVSFEAEPQLSSFNKKGDQATHLPLQMRGFPEPNRAYRWLRCSEAVAAPSSVAPVNCVAIPRATQATYTPVNDDVQKYLVLEVTISNIHNSQTQYTQSSTQILQTPEISGVLVMTGKQWVGQTLTAVGAVVAGFPTPTVSYQWFKNGSPIAGATGVTYTLREGVPGDERSLITYRVTAENRVARVDEDSVTSGVIGLPPRILGELPGVSDVEADGEISVGSTVRVGSYYLDSEPAPAAETFQWYSCANRYQQATIGGVPGDCVAIAKATKDELLVTFTHEGRYLGYSLVAKNKTDDKIWFSKTTARVYVKPKYVSGAKTSFATGQAAKDGSPRVGYTIEATNGTWRGSTTAEYSYRWFACDQKVTQSLDAMKDACDEIYREDGTASGRVLRISSDMIGKYIGVHIVGQYKYNALTDDPDFSNRDEVYTLSTTKPVIEPPVNVTPPRISSRYPYVGASAKGNDGTWRGTPTPTVSHLWWVCDSQILVATTVQPEGCVVVPKSTGNLTLAASQLGKYISLAATAVNSADTTTMWSVSSSEPVSTGPVNVTAPQISVTAPATLPSTLSVLSVSDGTWYSYQEPGWDGYVAPQLSSYNWFRCETQVTQASETRDNNCSLIEGAFQQTYTPVRADAGKFVMASVRFSNRDRQGVAHEWIAYSISTTVVNLPPANLEVPTINGAPFVDRAVPSSPGTWEGQPTPTYSYQWFACEETSADAVTGASPPANCVSIASATAERFTPKVAQLDKYLLLKVTGQNSVGSAIAWSTYSPAVVSGPVLKTPPTFTYASSLGHPLVSNTEGTQTDGGIWQGTPEPAKAYEWLACNTAVTTGSETSDASVTAGCEVIAGANESTINPAAATRGKFLMVHITAENIHGVAHWYSATTTAVWMAPVLDTPVSVFGTMFHELRAKAKFDTWLAFPEPTKTYQWFVCSSITITPAITSPNDCEPISGATSSIFTIPELAEDPLQDGFAQKHLVVRVTANNEVGVPAVSHSATSAAIKPGPVNTVSPVVSGQTVFALQTVTTLSATDGTWKPADETQTSRQWYRCAEVQPAFDELAPSCEAIGGETGPNYVLRAEDPGKAILVAVTGRSGELESVTYSASTPLISERVNNVANPFVQDPPIAGTAVDGDKGVWRGFPTPTVKTQAWYSCKTKVETATVSLVAKPKAPTGCTVLPKTNLPAFKIPDPPKKVDPNSLIGKFLVYSVTQENVVAGVKTTVTVFSPSTEKIAILPRLDPDRPELIRPAEESDDEDPSVGTTWNIRANWTAGEPTKTYQWYTCAAVVSSAPDTFTLPDGCTAVEGATNTSYTIRLADSGRFLMASATGVNSAGTVTAFSFSSDLPVGRAPQATTMPVLSGGRNDGDLLSVTAGDWDMETEPPTFKWYACLTPVTETTTSVPRTCEDLSETGSTYRQSAAFDGGKYITVLVSAKAAGASARATTSYLLAVTEGTRVTPSIALGNRLPRLNYDTYLVGDEFAIQSGQWEGLPAPALTYSWYRCATPVETPSATLPVGCTVIEGATAISYRAGNADENQYILGAETGTNNAGTGADASGSRTYYTETSDDPIESSFEMASLVSVSASGLEIDRDESVTITRTNGTWTGGTGDPVYVHRWVYCDKPVTTGAQLFPAGCFWMFDSQTGGRLDPQDTQTTLTLDMSTPFAGYYIASAEYLQKPGSPNNVENPANRVTYRLSATTGKIKIAPALWTIDVTDELVATTGNGGFKPPTVPTQAIVGESVTLTQIEQNSNGWYPTTDPLTMPPGKQVTWRGVEGGNFTYQWFQCETRISALNSSQPSGCSAITNATSKTYTPTGTDVRKYLSLKVTATNSAGTASIWTASTWHVTQKATSIGGPILEEISQTGEQATVSAGEWAGEEAPTFTYDWYICPTRTWSATCRTFSSASGSRTFTPITLGSYNVPKYLVARVKGSNYPYLISDFEVDRKANKKFDRETYVASAEPINEAPYWGLDTGANSLIFPMTISDSRGFKTQAGAAAANVGETLEFDFETNEWSAYPAIPSNNAYEYTWYGCTFERIGVFRTETAPADCVPVAGETSRELVITDALIGKRIMGRVKATNATGVGYIFTATTSPVAQKPFNINPPTISNGVENVPTVGVQSSGQLGTWGGSPAPQADPARYQWYSCPTQVSDSTTVQSGCTPIPNATNSYFTPTELQRGKYLVFKVGVKNIINPQQTTSEKAHFSAGYGPVHMDPAFDAADPQIIGDAHVGRTLTIPAPNVTSYPENATTSWDWYLCDLAINSKTLAQAPDTCSIVSTEPSQTTLTVADSYAGKFLAVFANSSNRPSVTKKKNSLTTLAITKQPTNTGVPSFTGTANVNGTNQFTPSAGSWSAFPQVNSRSYSWYLCTEAGIAASQTLNSSCAQTPISGLTSANLTAITLRREWAGKSLVLAETASQPSNNLPNSANKSVTHYSASSALLVSPPEFNALPSFSGTLHVGETLTSAFTKNFAYDPDSPTYQWFSCTTQVTNVTAPSGCAPISGATDAAYTLSTEDQVGKFITVRVTLTNSVTSVVRYALSGTQRVTMTPVNLSQVTVSGEALASASKTITANAGTWRSNPTAGLLYNWYLCPSANPIASTTLPDGCALTQASNNMPGANKTISVEPRHRGKYLLVAESAVSAVNKSGAGTTTVYSASTSVVNMAPEFASNASYSGTLHVGQVLTANVPAVQAYPLNDTEIEWWQCGSAVSLNASSRPADCTVIPNASASTLTLGSAQKGLFVALALRNANESGAATRVFASNLRVSKEPVNTVAPAISGSPNAATGAPIVVTTGNWDSFPVSTPSNFTYSWYSCPTAKAVSPGSVSDCVEITTPAATSSSFIPTNDLAGRHLVAKVTLRVATNLASASEASRFSASAGPVVTLPIFGAGSPSVSGYAHVGSILSGTHVSTSGFDAPRPSTSQWYQCDSAVSAGVATPPAGASCVAISGATSLSFTVTSAQEGKRLLLMQTATNDQGSVTRVSATTLPVTSTPSNQAVATLSGSKVYSSSATVSLNSGSWTGTPAPVSSNFSYSWYLCPSLTSSSQNASVVAGCASVEPVNVTSDGKTIRVGANWGGKYLVAKESVTTVTNTAAASPGQSFTAGFGPFAPSNTAVPTLSKTSVATGATIEARPGTWVFGETQNFSYRWFACTAAREVADSIPSTGCTLLPEGTTNVLTVPQSALGKYLVAEVSATNSGGTTIKTTKSTTGKVTAG